MNLALKPKYLILIFISILIECIFIGCGGTYNPQGPESQRSKDCPSVDKYNFDETIFEGTRVQNQSSFAEIRDTISSSCARCHQAPANSGGFSFIDAYKGEIKTISGKNTFYPGYFEIAEKVQESLQGRGPNKVVMPPAEVREQNPTLYNELNIKLQAWIKAGKIDGNFTITGEAKPAPTQTARIRRDELGECIPSSKIIGFDYQRDRFFANTEKLPKIF